MLEIGEPAKRGRRRGQVSIHAVRMKHCYLLAWQLTVRRGDGAGGSPAGSSMLCTSRKKAEGGEHPEILLRPQGVKGGHLVGACRAAMSCEAELALLWRMACIAVVAIVVHTAALAGSGEAR